MTGTAILYFDTIAYRQNQRLGSGRCVKFSDIFAVLTEIIVTASEMNWNSPSPNSSFRDRLLAICLSPLSDFLTQSVTVDLRSQVF